jgi:hypothetical protein
MLILWEPANDITIITYLDTFFYKYIQVQHTQTPTNQISSNTEMFVLSEQGSSVVVDSNFSTTPNRPSIGTLLGPWCS